MLKNVLGGVALVPLMIGTALAEVPAAVTGSLDEAKADAVMVAGLAIAIVVAIAAFKYMRSAIK